MHVTKSNFRPVKKEPPRRAARRRAANPAAAAAAPRWAFIDRKRGRSGARVGPGVVFSGASPSGLAGPKERWPPETPTSDDAAAGAGGAWERETFFSLLLSLSLSRCCWGQEVPALLSLSRCCCLFAKFIAAIYSHPLDFFLLLLLLFFFFRSGAKCTGIRPGFARSGASIFLLRWRRSKGLYHARGSWPDTFFLTFYF